MSHLRTSPSCRTIRCEGLCAKQEHRGLTRGRTRRDAGCRARRPSRLELSEMHGVTPLATRSRRGHVSRGKRRAAQPAAHLTASRGLTSRPLGRPRISQPHFSPARPARHRRSESAGRPRYRTHTGSGVPNAVGPTTSPRREPPPTPDRSSRLTVFGVGKHRDTSLL